MALLDGNTGKPAQQAVAEFARTQDWGARGFPFRMKLPQPILARRGCALLF